MKPEYRLVLAEMFGESRPAESPPRQYRLHPSAVPPPPPPAGSPKPPRFSEKVQRAAGASAQRRRSRRAVAPRQQRVSGGGWTPRIEQLRTGQWKVSVPNPRTMGGYWRKKFDSEEEARAWMTAKMRGQDSRAAPREEVALEQEF